MCSSTSCAAGPASGNIGPEQADIKLAYRGLGHGNTHAIVLAPSTPQEMLDMTLRAFDLSFTYRNSVIVLGDGYLGQMTGRVMLPAAVVKPGIPTWAVWGDQADRGNLISSIFLSEVDLEQHNLHLNQKYERMRAEAMAELFLCDDADVVLVACNTPARMAKGSVQQLRRRCEGRSLPPANALALPDRRVPAVAGARTPDVVVEASAGQLEDELRLALSHAGAHGVPDIESVQHYGGILPQQDEIVAKVSSRDEVHA